MEEKMRLLRDIVKFIVSIIICQLAGFVGSLFTTPAIQTWYATLNRSPFAPPNWLFAPVWTALFLLMGISLFLVWQKGIKEHKNRLAVIIFIIQLILNILWSILFFGLQSPFAAFIEIIVLWLAILFTIIKFYKISKTAGILLIPYILWVSFAAILNFSFWIINL
jgi:benzodiazapine receptor